MKFDEVLTGPRVRQIRPAELVSEAYAANGLRVPEAQVVPEFDEYDSGGVVGNLLPRLIQADAGVGELAEEYEKSRGTREEYRAFQRMFEVVMKAWVRGEMDPPELGSWQEFKAGVLRALGRIMDQNARSRRVAVFTSGGPICVAVQLALGLSV